MFSHKSFSPVSFSITSFKMAQEESVRSGYWRLYFYQMQEEALRKAKEGDFAEKAPVEAIKVRARSGVLPGKKVTKAKTTTPKQDSEAQACPVPRRKLFRPAAYVPSIPLPDTMWVYNTLNELRFTFPSKRSIVKPSESQATAINVADQDNRVLLLLLAA